MHSCWSALSLRTQRSSSSFVAMSSTCCSGPWVLGDSSTMSDVVDSSRYRLDLTWSKIRLRAIVTNHAPMSRPW